MKKEKVEKTQKKEWNNMTDPGGGFTLLLLSIGTKHLLSFVSHKMTHCKLQITSTDDIQKYLREIV